MLTKENICLTIFLFMNFCKATDRRDRAQGQRNWLLGTFSNFSIPKSSQSEMFTVSRHTKVNWTKYVLCFINYNSANQKAIEKNEIFWISKFQINSVFFYFCIKSKLEELRGYKVIEVMSHAVDRLLLSFFHSGLMRIHILKYQISGCKDIQIRKLENKASTR